MPNMLSVASAALLLSQGHSAMPNVKPSDSQPHIGGSFDGHTKLPDGTIVPPIIPARIPQLMSQNEANRRLGENQVSPSGQSILNQTFYADLSLDLNGADIEAASLNVQENGRLEINIDSKLGGVSGTLNETGHLENATIRTGISNVIFSPMSDGTTLEIGTLDDVENAVSIVSKASNGTVLNEYLLHDSDIIPKDVVEGSNPSTIFLSGRVDEDLNDYCEGPCWRALRITLSNPSVDSHTTIPSQELNTMMLSKTSSGNLLISGMDYSGESFLWEVDADANTLSCTAAGDYQFRPTTYKELNNSNRLVVGAYPDQYGLYVASVNGNSANWVNRINAFFLGYGRREDENLAYRPRVILMNNSDIVVATNLFGGTNDNDQLGVAYARLNSSTGDTKWQNQVFQTNWMTDLIPAQQGLHDQQGFIMTGDSFLINFDHNGKSPGCPDILPANLSITAMPPHEFSLQSRSNPEAFVSGTFYENSMSSYYTRVEEASIEKVTPGTREPIGGSINIICDPTDASASTTPGETTQNPVTTSTATTPYYPIVPAFNASQLNGNAPHFVDFRPEDQIYWAKLRASNKNNVTFYLSGNNGGWGGSENHDGTITNGFTNFGTFTDAVEFDDGTSIECQSGYGGGTSGYDSRIVKRGPDGSITDTFNLYNFSMFPNSFAAASNTSALINAYVFSSWCSGCIATVIVDTTVPKINLARLYLGSSLIFTSASVSKDGNYLVGHNSDNYTRPHLFEVTPEGIPVESLGVEHSGTTLYTRAYNEFQDGSRVIAEAELDDSKRHLLISKWGGNGQNWTMRINKASSSLNTMYYPPRFVQTNNNTGTILFNRKAKDEENNNIYPIAGVNFNLNSGQVNWDHIISHPGPQFMAMSGATHFKNGIQFVGVGSDPDYNSFGFLGWLNESGYNPGCNTVRDANLDISYTELPIVPRSFPNYVDVNIGIGRVASDELKPTNYISLNTCGNPNFTGLTAAPVPTLPPSTTSSEAQHNSSSTPMPGISNTTAIPSLNSTTAAGNTSAAESTSTQSSIGANSSTATNNTFPDTSSNTTTAAHMHNVTGAMDTAATNAMSATPAITSSSNGSNSNSTTGSTETGIPTADVSNATTGNPVATTGSSGAITGNSVATAGNSGTTSGDSVAATGDSGATAGNSFAATGDSRTTHTSPTTEVRPSQTDSVTTTNAEVETDTTQGFDLERLSFEDVQNFLTNTDLTAEQINALMEILDEKLAEIRAESSLTLASMEQLHWAVGVFSIILGFDW